MKNHNQPSQPVSMQSIPVDSLKKTISYFYLLSFCPPERMEEFKSNTKSSRELLAASAGLDEKEYFELVIPEVCRRIAAFHLDTREPDSEQVQLLSESALTAYHNPSKAVDFQQKMAGFAALPGRAKTENRLHRNKGCIYCRAACRYGYFSLVSDPAFRQLQELLREEAGKPDKQKSPLGSLYKFALGHLVSLLPEQEIYITVDHLGNLSYCLLMLAMAKSRMALPAKQLELLQAANQSYIRRSG
jgi:hypothetical protein